MIRKKSSDEQSVELYIDTVKKSITKKQISNPNFKPSKCNIKENGSLDCEGILVEIEIEGMKPNNGIVTIEENKIYFYNIEYNGKKYYLIVKLIKDVSSQGISPGDKYEYEVSPGTKYTFYVLKTEEDEVHLIMDRNICGSATDSNASTNGQAATSTNLCTIAWHTGSTDNTYGPDTAMQGLYNATKSWINVPIIDLSGSKKYTDADNETDNGYTEISTNKGVATIIGKPKTKITTIGTESKPLRARLPKYSEINGAGCTKNSGTCPAWLTNGLSNYSTYYPENEYISGINGYWLLTSLSSNTSYARDVYYEGRVAHTSSRAGGLGIRPVITVPRSYLE